MTIKHVSVWMMVFTPCFAFIAGIFIGITASDSKHIDEDKYYCKPIPEIHVGAKICKPN